MGPPSGFLEASRYSLAVGSRGNTGGPQCAEMGVPQRVRDVKMLNLEEGRADDADLDQEGHLHNTNYLKLFKWFININVLLLLIFCGYALCSLYQLESAMKSRESSINLDRYLHFRYNDAGSSNHSELNDSLEEFNEWRRSVVKGLENSPDTKPSNNLNVLLHSIASVARNFVDDERKPRNQVLIANLTDFEIRILREFAKLKMADRETRARRTVQGGPDESQCDLQFSFQPDGTRRLGNVVVKPVKYGQGMVNIKNTINNNAPGNKSETRECTFSIVYEPATS